MLRPLIWIISVITAWGLAFAFGVGLERLMLSHLTGREIAPAVFVLIVIQIPGTFVIWVFVWAITHRILGVAGLADKKKKIPPQS